VAHWAQVVQEGLGVLAAQVGWGAQAGRVDLEVPLFPVLLEFQADQVAPVESWAPVVLEVQAAREVLEVPAALPCQGFLESQGVPEVRTVLVAQVAPVDLEDLAVL
jgi:hypothetical protein